MLHRTIALLCTAGAFSAVANEPSPSLEGAALAKALKQGGYTLYFRHAITDRDQRDRNVVIGDCATQRNLKAEGREQARRIGVAIKSLALPVGEVIASPYCRAHDTGMLIAGRAQPVPAVAGTRSPTGGLEFTELGKILATPPAAGTLRVVAGHDPSHAFEKKAPALEEGEAMLVEPLAGDWRIVARIRAADWERLATLPAS